MRLTGILAAAAALIATPAVADTTIIHASSVITDASGEASGPATITVTDGKIVSIDDGWLATPESATMVHLEGKTALPGMIDLHTHLSGDPSGDYWKRAVNPPE